jgi:adenylate cyclase
MTAEKFKRKLEAIFSADTLDRLKKAGLRYWKSTPTALKAIATIIIALNAGWQLYSRLGPSVETPKEKAVPSVSKIEVASREKMAFPLPDKPSIAVLPFDCTSSDPKYKDLGDGITDEIINALGKSSQLLVIARNSTFTYKGKPVRVQQVSEEMGVRYVLEGSTQVSGKRVRIGAHLVDALQGYTLFSERYERDLKNIFSIQDEIALKILATIHVKLTSGEEARVYAKGTQNLDAYLKMMQVRELNRGFNKEDLFRARQLAEECFAIDPNYALAYSYAATAIFNAVIIVAYKNPRAELEHGMELIQKAIALDPSLGQPRTMLALYHIRLNKDYEKAIAEIETAMNLEPSSATVFGNSGTVFYLSGRYEDALHALNMSRRLSPISSTTVLWNLANTYRLLGRYEEALAMFRETLRRSPNQMPAKLGLVATLMLMGREREARAEAEGVLKIDPNFSLESFAKMQRQGFKNQEDVERLIIEPLRKAGLR